MCYRIAGIDVHKKVLAVVVSDVEVDGECRFEGRMFGSNPEQLRSLAAWLLEQEVDEVVMESTAQYWKPVWEALERYWQPIRQKREGAGRMLGSLHLAQAQSNRARRGRKRDFPDAERLVKRLVARELTLSFVPDAEQRLWRTVTRRKYQLTRDHVRLQNQLESLLEEAHIKLSSLVSNLLGASARRMLKALADGETNPAAPRNQQHHPRQRRNPPPRHAHRLPTIARRKNRIRVGRHTRLRVRHNAPRRPTRRPALFARLRRPWSSDVHLPRRQNRPLNSALPRRKFGWQRKSLRANPLPQRPARPLQRPVPRQN
jgi:hypothetical protein